MVDLNLPDGMNDEERVRWLENVGIELARETGDSSGFVVHDEGTDQQPSFVIWNLDDLDTLDGRDSQEKAESDWRS